MPAALVRHVNQITPGLFHRSLPEGGQDLIIIDQIGQAITAKQQIIIGEQAQALVCLGFGSIFSAVQPDAEINLGRGRSTQVAADNVRVWVAFNLVRGKQTALQRFLYPGVVGAELADGFPTHQVDARVSHRGGI